MVLSPQQHRQFKREIYGELARIGQAIAHPSRLELLELLAQGEHSVEELARELQLPLPATSQHLRVLREARLVTTRRAGRHSFYRIADPSVLGLLRAVRTTAERQLAEVTMIFKRYLGDRSTYELETDLQELVAAAERGEVLLLDVRPEPEYHAGHLPGAQLVPPDRLAALPAALPRDLTVVAYCRGPHCIYADEAVAVLQAAGFRAYRLRLGVPDFRLLGLPIVSEDAA
ncbi:MAG: ArsR/SmtB family transcription factor [Thermomicrobium sp.]